MLSNRAKSFLIRHYELTEQVREFEQQFEVPTDLNSAQELKSFIQSILPADRLLHFDLTQQTSQGYFEAGLQDTDFTESRVIDLNYSVSSNNTFTIEVVFEAQADVTLLPRRTSEPYITYDGNKQQDFKVIARYPALLTVPSNVQNFDDYGIEVYDNDAEYEVIAL